MMTIESNFSHQRNPLDKITVLIVDDSKTIAESIESILKGHDDIEVVGTASDGYDAIAKTRLLKPQVILMDAQMPSMDGADAIRFIRQEKLDTRILFLAIHATHVEDAMQAGADSFIMKDAGRQELLDHIRSLINHIKTS